MKVALLFVGNGRIGPGEADLDGGDVSDWLLWGGEAQALLLAHGDGRWRIDDEEQGRNGGN